MTESSPYLTTNTDPVDNSAMNALSRKLSIPYPVFMAVLFAISPSHLVAANATDLPNFHTVAPGIYRGGAPTEAGLVKLKQMGIRTVVDLRIAPKTVAKEHRLAQGLGFRWINLPMGSDPPTAKEVATLISTLKTAPQQPVFVHCQHGADRTGCMIGIWRETQQGWTYTQALAEMRRYGFNPHWTKLADAVRVRQR